jgi:hypothetical protein
MINILTALILLGVIVAPYVFPDRIPEPLLTAEYQTGVLLLFVGYLLVEGIRQRRPQTSRTGDDPARALREKNSELAERVRGLEGELATVSGEVREGRERAEGLARALAEAQARLAAAPARSGAQASSQSVAEALQMLALLQQRGRFVDFVMQDIAPISNEQIGAVARFVHQGCRSVFDELFEIEPVREEGEGAAITLAGAPDPEQLRIQGRTPTYPTQATIVHRGWLTNRVTLPSVTAERQPPYVIAPADAEVR